jgi:excisionase family DNA binding protein
MKKATEINEEISPREYAKRTGTRLDTTYAALWAGRIRARQVDGKWRIPAAAVEDTLRKKRTRAHEQN